MEILRYLDNDRAHTFISSRPSNLDPDETHKMSKDCSNYVSLAEFAAVPRGGIPDPAKKVCNPEQSYLAHRSNHYQGLCEEAQELCCTMDVQHVNAARDHML